MPNRILKESICVSETLEHLSWFEEVLFYRLIVSCDDYGRYDGRAAVIKNRLFPLKDGLSQELVESALVSLAEQGLICRYEAEGKPCLYLCTWEKHQTIRAKRSKYPDPAGNCMQMLADVPVIQSNTGSESNTKSKAGIQSESHPDTKPSFTPPSQTEVEKYGRELQSPVRPEQFYNYYRSRGWKGIQDWKAAFRLWTSRQTALPASPPPIATDELNRLRTLSASIRAG